MSSTSYNNGNNKIKRQKLLLTHQYFRIPGMTIATDIICGFPTETEQDFDETLSLCDEYKFPSLFINQYFPRPGTPAARLPRIPANEVKQRTKKLTDLFNSYHPYRHKKGEIQDVLVTDISHDKKFYVGHNKFYEQVLVPMDKDYMGKIVRVEIVETGKFSMISRPLDKIVRPGLVEPLNKGELSGVKSVDNSSIAFYAICMLVVAFVMRFIWFLTGM